MSPRLGILGGSFDPIHIGHLALAESARTAFALERVFFVPTAVPPHKGPPVVAAEHRLAMVRLAIMGNSAFRALPLELERPGPSYTVDTLMELGRRYPDRELRFIVGADEMLDLADWHEPTRILELTRFIAATRPGFDLGRLDEALGRLGPAARQRVDLLPWLALGVSSSLLREMMAAGQPVRYLVPDTVLAYIGKHGLYHAVGGHGA